MHPKTEELFYPDERTDAESLRLTEYEHNDNLDLCLDIITDDVVYGRLDQKLLAEHAVAVDREFDARLKAKEGEPGYSDNEGVTAYEHEETLMNVVGEWIDANVDVESLVPYVDIGEAELHRHLHQKIYDKVRPIDQELWETGKHPDVLEEEERKTLQAGEDALIPLTEDSSDDWSLHIRNSAFIINFSRVTMQEGGGIHLWSNDRYIMFVAEDDDMVPVPIQEKLREIAGVEGD